jgi:putative membrane protein
LALWIWHAPGLFDAAVEREWLHTLEHVSFFGTALLFWRAILDAQSARRVGPALAAAFATLMHGGLLGGLITMAPFPLYSWYRGRTELWGLTSLEDQQLAGLVMWVPMGIVYFAACILLASHLLVSEEDRHHPARRGDLLSISEGRH